MPLLQTLNQYNKATTVNYSKKYKDIITKPFKIYIIQTVLFILLARKRDYKIFIITMENIKIPYNLLPKPLFKTLHAL